MFFSLHFHSKNRTAGKIPGDFPYTHWMSEINSNFAYSHHLGHETSTPERISDAPKFLLTERRLVAGV